MADALFLDFDGVICDSVNECFVSSWIAFQERYCGNSPMAVPIEHYAQFRRLRPFIRTGQDFVLVHEMIAHGISAGSQAEFDTVAERAGSEKMATFDSLLYAVREDLVARQIDFWLPLHRLYGSLGASLQSVAANPQVWIVSTKRSEFIVKILEHWEIDWERSRIVLPVGTTKIDLIGSIMREHDYSTGIFVDDQPDHLRCKPGGGLECRLAEWANAGWVTAGPAPTVGGRGNHPAPTASGAELISLAELCELVDSFGR